MMSKRYTFMAVLILAFVLLPVFSFADCKRKVDHFDKKFYHPEEIGLNDLSFQVRLPNMKKLLNQEKIFGVIKDIYFQVYWMAPQTYKIDVVGLPNGFQERKEQLRRLVRNRLDFVIPQKLAPKLRAYMLSHNKNKNGDVSCKGVDSTHTKMQNHIEVLFDKNGKLKRFHTSSPSGVSEAESIMSSRMWSKNKWVLDDLVVRLMNMHKISTVMKHKISYKQFSGFGFPVKIKTLTTYESKMVAQNDSLKIPKIESQILFSKYEVNTGKASRIIRQELKKIKKSRK
ncbi:MAG: hypothetical protein KAQ98_02010 [Bacteriovoracaceae bacterium]|nr:hypothetical protein [Bacteriovoracaceae bacterium]